MIEINDLGGSKRHMEFVKETMQKLERGGYNIIGNGIRIAGHHTDILVEKKGERISVECGSVDNPSRIPDLCKVFDKVLHIGFSGRVTEFTREKFPYDFIKAAEGGDYIYCKKDKSSRTELRIGEPKNLKTWVDQQTFNPLEARGSLEEAIKIFEIHKNKNPEFWKDFDEDFKKVWGEE